MNEGLIPKHGRYRNFKSFQVAQVAYDLTVDFVDRYVDPKSRTRDQMVQAARSGVQNIAEGSQVSATSKKMEMKLTSIARASLEELRLDYEDFLRHRKLLQWDRVDPDGKASSKPVPDPWKISKPGSSPKGPPRPLRPPYPPNPKSAPTLPLR